jgi:hypothetical protein
VLAQTSPHLDPDLTTSCEPAARSAGELTDEAHEIRSNRAGIVIGAALPQVVLSGYGLFHIGELK